MSPDAKEEIELQFRLLENLVESFRPLINKVAEADPNLVETAALGSVLQSFYNGVESIFQRIAKDVEGSAPIGDAWHSQLLQGAARAGPRRPAVISEGLRRHLRDYLEFRHVFRATYTILLRWDRMAHLVTGLDDTLHQLQAEVHAFLAAQPD